MKKSPIFLAVYRQIRALVRQTRSHVFANIDSQSGLIAGIHRAFAEASCGNSSSVWTPGVPVVERQWGITLRLLICMASLSRTSLNRFAEIATQGDALGAESVLTIALLKHVQLFAFRPEVPVHPEEDLRLHRDAHSVNHMLTPPDSATIGPRSTAPPCRLRVL